MKSAIRNLSFVVVLSMLASVATAAGSVIVVDAAGGPGADFSDLSNAVSAAASGDTLLVRSGDYNEFLDVDGKSLTVIAEVDAVVRVWEILVSNLAATDVVAIRGITPDGAGFESAVITNCAGTVWFEDCYFQTVFTAHVVSGGVRATDSSKVVFSRCVFEAAKFFGGFGLPALTATESAAYLFDCSVTGDAPNMTLGQAESPAILVDDGLVSLTGSTVIGGNGPSGNIFVCEAGDGGDGVQLTGAAPELLLMDSNITPGVAGTPTNGCAPAEDGVALIVESGTVTTRNATARSLEVSSPVRDNGSAQVTFTGEPNEPVWVYYTETVGQTITSRKFDGDFVAGAMPQKFFAGTLSAAGTTTAVYPAEDLGPGVEAMQVFAQSLHRDPTTSRFVVSSPSLIVLLDQSF